MNPNATGANLGPRFDIVAADAALALKELQLPAGAAILDVGTGSGFFAIYLATQGYQVLTGEPSTDTSIYAARDWAQLARGAGVFDRIRFQSFDASLMPFESQSFDAVFFFGVLHHIEEQARTEVLREALRVAKENGVVVFFEPQRKMLEKIWVDDPAHPLAANPSTYLPAQGPEEQRIEGAFMDIFLYRKNPLTCAATRSTPALRR